MTLFIQWNINGFYKRSVGINRIIYDLQPSILCLQETNLKINHSASIKNYTGYFKIRTDALRASGGVATFIKDTIDSENIPITSDFEVIATLVKLQKPLCICNIYIPDSKIFTKQHLKNLIKQLPKPFVLLGDFNSRNTSWGCNYTDNRGQMVEEFLEEETLILLNNNEPTRHNVSNGNFSAIDLTITNINSTTLFDWQVLPAYSDSDHWPIGIQYQNHLIEKKCSTKWNLKNPNWDLFSEKIEFELSQNPLDLHSYGNQLEIDTIVRKFTDIIIEAANLSIGLKTYKDTKKSVPWWNKECQDAIKNYKKNLNRYKKTKSITDHIQLKKTRAIARFITKKSKTSSWQTFTSSIKHKIPSNIIWNKINSIRGNIFNTIPDILLYNQKRITSTQNASEAFANYFHKNNSDENYNPDFITFRNSTPDTSTPLMDQNNEPFNNHIDISELLSALQSCKSKSPGPDNIPYSFIKNLPLIGIKTILQIYNSIWSQGIFPNQWRHAYVVPIPKPNKSKFDIENYRPISLINTLSKLMEKIINKRLIWYLESSKLLTKEQCGFRKNHSTLDALTSLHTDICSAFRRNHHLITIALDITKAYDTVWRKRVLTILYSWKINGNLLNFIKNFLTDRTFSVKVYDKISSPHHIENGLPQGSVLSVTLFLVAINDICNNLPKPAKFILFADDCSIYCSGSQIITTTRFLQQALDALARWSSETGFSFSPTKTQCIIFNKKKKEPLPILNFMNTQLPFANSIRILGLTFDHKLTWRPHLKKLKTECQSRIKTLKILGNNNWGADTNSLITVYKALILSSIDYGDIIYHSAKQKVLSTLEPIHNQGIRLAIGAFRTSPVDSILYYAGEAPLHLRRQNHILKYVTKIKNLSDHITKHVFHNPLSPNILPSRRTLLENFNIISENLSFQAQTLNKIQPSHPPWLWSPIINTKLTEYCKQNTDNSIIRNQFLEIIHQQFPEYSQIYTDASKNTSGVGFSVITNQENHLFQLPSSTSVYTAETYAIYEALKIVLSSNQKNCSIIISDSLSALSSISNPYPKNELVQHIQKLISEINRPTSFMWVPSHVGIPGNEKADTIAYEATTSPSSTKINTLTSSETFNIIQHKLMEEWQKFWSNLPLSNKLRNVKLSIKKLKYPPNTKRREEVNITRAKIGHSHLTHAYLIRKEPAPICDTCNETLTIEHIIINCAKYTEARKTLKNPTTLHQALNEDNTDAINLFFHNINISHKL